MQAHINVDKWKVDEMRKLINKIQYLVFPVISLHYLIEKEDRFIINNSLIWQVTAGYMALRHINQWLFKLYTRFLISDEL